MSGQYILRRITAAALVAVIVAVAGGAGAIELFDPLGQPVTVKTYKSFTTAPQGGVIGVAIVLEMKDHWHVNANQVDDPYLIPTTVEFDLPAGMTVEQLVYPDGIKKKLDFSDEPMNLYEGEAAIGAVVRVSPDFALGDTSITATVTYQACDNMKCLVPVNKRLRVALTVSSPTEAMDATYPEVFGRIQFDRRGDGGAAQAAASGRLGKIIASRGYFIAFLLVFVWGLALNLTPCVYPIIPITVGFFGGQAAGKTSRTLFLAVLYVLGMATMYSALGLMAALTGGILGAVLQNEFVVAFVALVLVGLALSMFGVWEFRVPARLASFAGGGRQGTIGAYLMGLTVGIVAAPCIGPLVLALLTFVGESANPVLGFWMFFTLALGLGTPFIFLAVLSGSISRLPKSGEWMDWVKRLFGFVLIAMAVFFLEPVIGDVPYFLLMGIVVFVGGIFLGFLRKTQSTALAFIVFKRFVGIAAPLFGLWLLFAPGHIIARHAPEGIPWTPYSAESLASARANDQFVLIDFSAEWCLPCKELDHRTFSEDEVVAATKGMVTLRADLTDAATPAVAALRKDYKIKGVPTVVFLDRDGKEREDLRVFGFVDADDFLERLERLKGRSLQSKKSS